MHDNRTPSPDLVKHCVELLTSAANGLPRPVCCCTPEQAREWAELVADDAALHAAALRHVAEVEDAWAP